MTDVLIEHRYTVLEIDRIRVAVGKLMLPEAWMGPNSSWIPGSGGTPADIAATAEKIESQLRTYMLAGTRPEELELLQAERHQQFLLSRPKPQSGVMQGG